MRALSASNRREAAKVGTGARAHRREAATRRNVSGSVTALGLRRRVPFHFSYCLKRCRKTPWAMRVPFSVLPVRRPLMVTDSQPQPEKIGDCALDNTTDFE